MKLDKAKVARISRLARIATTDDEQERLASELSAILEWIEQLGEVDTDGVEPMTSVVAMTPGSREDAVTDGGMADEITANAPESSRGFFVVPKVVE